MYVHTGYCYATQASSSASLTNSPSRRSVVCELCGRALQLSGAGCGRGLLHDRVSELDDRGVKTRGAYLEYGTCFAGCCADGRCTMAGFPGTGE